MGGVVAAASGVERASRFWLAGCYVPPADGEPRRWDMQVQFVAREGCKGVALGLMTHQLVGEVRRVRTPGGVEREVQTFRYAQADGSSGVLLFCGTCGRVVGLRSENVDLGRLGACDACGCEASADLCVAGHAFGSCARCAGKEAVR